MSINLEEYERRFPSHISALYEVHKLSGRVIELERAQEKNRPLFQRMKEEIRQLRAEVSDLQQNSTATNP